ncbi:MAG: class I SAM-dependent methyltransferase [Candidatus Dojkabacteria bacterium]
MLNGITLAIVIIVALLFSSFVLTLLISALLVPLFKTPKDVLEEIIDVMGLKKEDTLVDLGSGDGRLLLKGYEQSQCKCIGYDISPIMMILANTNRILSFPFSKDIVFRPEDIFKVNFENVTKIYCYLDGKSLNILKKKLDNFLREGGEVYSYKYEIEGMKNSKQVILKNNIPLYVYRGRRGEHFN